MSEKKENKITGAMGKMAHVGKGFAAGIKSGGETVISKIKENNSKRRFYKLNPVFPEQYKDDKFHLPNVIKIVDDAVRRGIKECEGAIGWLDTIAGVEVLHLYDEAIDFSGIQFIPTATCDSMYYVDQHDRTRFLRTDCIFSKAHEERVAELEHIAYCLGAKRCWVELKESNTSSQTVSKKWGGAVNSSELTKNSNSDGKGIDVNAIVGTERGYANSNSRSGKGETVFIENNTLKHPELKWFANEDCIKRLIEMRLDNTSSIEYKKLEISGQSSATMTKDTAVKIDAILECNKTNKNEVSGKKTFGGHVEESMSNQANKEYETTMFFHIEF